MIRLFLFLVFFRNIKKKHFEIKKIFLPLQRIIIHVKLINKFINEYKENKENKE